jgi:paraquat-inducible protein A
MIRAADLAQTSASERSAKRTVMNDTAPSEPRVPIIACHECGLIHRMRELPDGRAAKCTRCGAVLYRERRDSLERVLILTIAALILYVLAHSFPFLTFKLEGQEQVSRLLTGVVELYREGMWPLALLVFVVGSLVPLVKLLGNLYVLVPLRFGRRPPGLALVFRFIEVLHPWAMMEVYLLGILVAYVKLIDLARIELGVAVYSFAALIVTMVAAEAALDPRKVWATLGAQARASLPLRASGTLLGCHDCNQVVRAPRHGHGLRCPRCGAPLHPRKPHSIARTWALIIAACILYIPANVLPVMSVISFGRGSPDTILSGVKVLIEHGMWPIAALVFFASITVPVLKLIALTCLLISVQRASTWRQRDRTLIYRVTEAVGRWSMVDIFVIAILVALVSLGSIATIEPGPGAMCFAGVVVITMFAAMTFDPRLIWDAQEQGHVGRQAG